MLTWELLAKEQDVLVRVPEDFDVAVRLASHGKERTVFVVLDFKHGSPDCEREYQYAKRHHPKGETHEKEREETIIHLPRP